ncbi:protein ULTRAPETALA 2-like [Juglans regia]|uniref:Protein ULTRAPETALA 2-like n=2 Tax=Juglans regia TaxID=51240 RepID=A0A2I4H4V8_JUGRE|nr:protein ULTRAPETALA 2-like [Juglans regia]
MAEGDHRHDEDVNAIVFDNEELNNMSELERGPDFIEVKCGYTNKKYGDFVGKLRISVSGHFMIDCKCYPECSEATLTPDNFLKHCGKLGTRNWKRNIWIIVNDEKVSLQKTVLLNYYRNASNISTDSKNSKRERKFHRDEFIKCSTCNKERRFRLRNREERRIYHDALANERWRCADRPYDKITCADEEERVCRKICRGCPRSATCPGCPSCVCFGCLKCRFPDCECRTCVDFIQNAEP